VIAATFNPADEFELKQWVAIHLGPLDMSINKAVVYLAISDKIVNGSPYNAVSAVPIMPWGK